MSGAMEELPEGWETTKLSEVTEYVTSGSRDWSQYYASEGALFVRTQDINTNKLCELSQIAKVHLPAKVEGKRTLIKRDDLLITITGANVGKCAHILVDIPEAYVSQSVALVRVLECSWARIIHKQLITPADATGKTGLEIRAYGMGRPVLNLDNVRDVPIIAIPLAEQKVIADKLDALLARVGTLKARLDAIPAILKRFRQSVLSAAVTGKLTEEWRRKYQDDSAKWKNSTINDIAEVKGGKRLPAGESVLDEKTLYPYLRVTDFSEFTIDESNLKYLSESTQKCIKRYTISSNDVFISIAGTIGSVGMVPTWLDGANLTENAAKIVVNSELAYSKYVMFHLAGPISQAEIAGSVVSNTQPKLALFRIQKLAITLPPLPEQTEIVRRVESLFTFADQIEARAQEATAQVKHLTQSILAKAFRGELTEEWRKMHPELVSGQNSAEALLERIRAARAAAPEAKGKRGRKASSESDASMLMAAESEMVKRRGRPRKG